MTQTPGQDSGLEHQRPHIRGPRDLWRSQQNEPLSPTHNHTHSPDHYLNTTHRRTPDNHQTATQTKTIATSIMAPGGAVSAGQPGRPRRRPDVGVGRPWLRPRQVPSSGLGSGRETADSRRGTEPGSALGAQRWVVERAVRPPPADPRGDPRGPSSPSGAHSSAGGGWPSWARVENDAPHHRLADEQQVKR